MKKIIGLLFSFAVVLSFTACDDDDYTSPVSTLKVVRSEVTFSARAGEGYIEVESATPVQAKSSQPWCEASVSGNSVKVAVTALGNIESRSAVVTVSNSDDSVEVPVYQLGAIFSLAGESAYLVAQEDAGSVELPAKITVDYTASASASWVHWQETADGFLFTFDDNDGAYRKAVFTVTSVAGEKSVAFGQMGTDGMTGSFTARYQDTGGAYEYPVTVTQEGSTYYIEGLVEEGVLPLTYNASTGEFDLNNGYCVGTWNGYYLYTLINFTNGTSNYYSYNTTSATYHIVFAPGVDEEGNFTIRWIDSGRLSSSYYQLGFNVNAFKQQTFSSTYNAGWLYMFRNLVMTR